MISRFKAAWAKAPWLMSGFALALALTLLFGARMISSAIYWADPSHNDQVIEGWMTPGYVAMSWDVPRELLRDVVDVTPDSGWHPRLQDIAAERGIPFSTLSAEIEAAIILYRDDTQ